MKITQVKQMLKNTTKRVKILSFAFLTSFSLSACSLEFIPRGENEIVDKLADAAENIDVSGAAQEAGKLAGQVVKEVSDQAGGAVKDNTDKLVSSAKEKIENADWDGIAKGEKDAADSLAEDIKNLADDFSENNPQAGTFQKANIVRVVDGDTIVVDIEADGCNSVDHQRKVRLIGVDTPESVASEEYLEKTGKENSQEGKDASKLTKSILENAEYVYLQKDTSDTDKYDRLLRYVWLSVPQDEYDIGQISEKMLQGVLLSEKAAVPMKIEPDTKHADDFEEIYSMD